MFNMVTRARAPQRVGAGAPTAAGTREFHTFLGVRCGANHDHSISDEEGAKEDDEEEEHGKDSYDQRAVAAGPAHRPEQLVSTWLGIRVQVQGQG